MICNCFIESVDRFDALLRGKYWKILSFVGQGNWLSFEISRASWERDGKGCIEF